MYSNAIVSEDAKIGKNVEIGPFTTIGPNVVIGDNTIIGSNVVINGNTTIGKDNRIFQFCSIGEIPQDKKYLQEDTKLVIGDRNTFREYCSVHCGTSTDQGITSIGNDNLFLAYVHIAHDCVVGSHTTFSNCSQLAGHVVVGDHASMGGFSGVHQFCRIGCHSFISGGTMVVKDILPYTLVSGNPPKPYGLNQVGLKRRGFSESNLSLLKTAYKIICRDHNTVQDAIDHLKQLTDDNGIVKKLINFMSISGGRGFTR